MSQEIDAHTEEEQLVQAARQARNAQAARRQARRAASIDINAADAAHRATQKRLKTSLEQTKTRNATGRVVQASCRLFESFVDTVDDTLGVALPPRLRHKVTEARPSANHFRNWV